MATFSVVSTGQLDAGAILAAERYDPRRSYGTTSGKMLSAIVAVASDMIDSKRAAEPERFLVLDTGDAKDGRINARKAIVGVSGLGSAKKRVRSGDVIVSRLRPYLRQVALVDAGLFDEVGSIKVVVSTEFYVLRPRENRPIGFLVPFLLSEPVQQALQAAQEGGHHPRFTQQMLEGLVVPDEILSERDTISSSIENAVSRGRKADLAIHEMVVHCGSSLKQDAKGALSREVTALL